MHKRQRRQTVDSGCLTGRWAGTKRKIRTTRPPRLAVSSRGARHQPRICGVARTPGSAYWRKMSTPSRCSTLTRRLRKLSPSRFTSPASGVKISASTSFI
jgi:hypothetical protein